MVLRKRKRISVRKTSVFGRSAYAISVNGKKKFFEFNKADATKKANTLRKK